MKNFIQIEDNGYTVRICLENIRYSDRCVIRDRLWRCTESIDTRIEPVLLDEMNDQSGFCEHILKTGIEL